jgi:ubiquinone/menaquinone biosynthesis C-methylase UbiE
MQWNRFRQTQLDQFSGHPISADRFWKATGWKRERLAGQWVLDVGCGAGRFAEVALKAGARVIALDFSQAVDACWQNLGSHPNFDVVQGDVYALPFPNRFFPFVYSLGVLQHTPDVATAFAAIPRVVAPGGRLCVDFYGKRVGTMFHAKYAVRPLTKRMPPERLFALLQRVVPVLLRVSQGLGRVPSLGRVLKRLVPVADYTGILPLDSAQLKEWALLDTFDMLAPQYDQPQSAKTVKQWFEIAGMAEIEILQASHLVGRSRQPS